MTTSDRFSWTCPLDDRQIGILLVADSKLFFSLSVEADRLEQLPEGSAETIIEKALPKRYKSISVSHVQSLQMVTNRSQIRVVGLRKRILVPFRRNDRAVAGEAFNWLAQKLGLEEIREVRRPSFESLAGPISALLFVLVLGMFLGASATRERAEQAPMIIEVSRSVAQWIGPSTIWLGTTLGAILSLVWLGARATHPPTVLIASRPQTSNSSASPKVGIDESELRIALAAVLDIDPDRITKETRLMEDLRIPPGELQDRLQDLEERLNIDCAGAKIRTFGDLLEVVKLIGV